MTTPQPLHSSSFLDWGRRWLKATGQLLWIRGYLCVILHFVNEPELTGRMLRTSGSDSIFTDGRKPQTSRHAGPCVNSVIFCPANIKMWQTCEFGGEPAHFTWNWLYLCEDNARKWWSWWSLKLCTEPSTGISIQTPFFLKLFWNGWCQIMTTFFGTSVRPRCNLYPPATTGQLLGFTPII